MSKMTIAAWIALLGCGAQTALAGVLYFSEDDNFNGLYTLDVNDGSATSVGLTGVSGGNVGLAPSGSPGVLYGSEWHTLLHINSDGSGFENVGGAESTGLAYDPRGEGTLYAGLRGNFFRMDPATGINLGDLAAPGADVEGLAYGNGFIYGIAGTNGGGAPGDLMRYDIDAGFWTNLGNTGIGAVHRAGLAYDNERDLLYTKSDHSSMLFAIDPDTLSATIVGDTGIAFGGGLAFVSPSPGTAAMLLLAGVAGSRRRLR